jgi:peptidoglycan/xylan/chitin deacetylase (PgdA/CDA1 family)
MVLRIVEGTKMHLKTQNKILIGLIIFSIVLSSCFTVSGLGFKKAEAGTDSVVVPILMYHEVKRHNVGKDVITPYEIESDLKYLKENQYTTISIQDLIDFVNKKKELPAKPIILSFDDGYLNNYVYVYPLLKKYDKKIVLSIIGKNTDDFTRIPDDSLDYSHVTWDQINEMMKSGLVEIQNHTYNMHHITRRRYGCRRNQGESLEHYNQALTEDITKLQQEIIQMTGYTPNTFTYPYGRVSEESCSIIKRLGFKASLTCDYGVNIITRDPERLYGLKRICRSHGISAKKSIQEGMKTLKYRKQGWFTIGRWFA